MEARFVCNSMEKRQVKPQQGLGFLQLLGVLFVAAIGGAYGMEDCVRTGGGLWTIIGVAVLPWVWGLPTALCVAELATSLPANSGPDAWIGAAFPTWFAVMSIFWTFFVNRIDNSVYPNLFVDYLTPVVDLSSFEQACIKTGFVAICCFLNILGIEIVGKASVFLMLLTILPFVLMFAFEAPNMDLSDLFKTPEAGVSWKVFLPMIAWNVSGFDSAGHVVEEVRTSGTILVKALVVLLFITQVVYALPVLAGVSAQRRRGYSGYSDSASGYDPNSTLDYSDWTDGFWVDIGRWIEGDWLADIITVGGCVSAFGFMCSLLCTTSRALQGHAMLGLFPSKVNKVLSYLHPQYKTPVPAIVVNSVLCLGLSLVMEFDTLVSIDSVLYSLRLTAILCSCYVLRVKHPTLPRPFKIPLAPRALAVFLFVPICFCLVCTGFGAVADVLIFGVSSGLVLVSLVLSVFLSRYKYTEGLDVKIEYWYPSSARDDERVPLAVQET
eukprot:TRINITY_DN7266_c0_g1_i1.p1 TRINITY_DN7266_c0_g1~~TRINITY_DN7266_c0_g1_i1.p1  ORF type:complete len:505 (+),score=41.21 TRINITY_DN7266_c0_g1_i1:32-1516(+)